MNSESEFVRSFSDERFLEQREYLESEFKQAKADADQFEDYERRYRGSVKMRELGISLSILEKRFPHLAAKYPLEDESTVSNN